MLLYYNIKLFLLSINEAIAIFKLIVYISLFIIQELNLKMIIIINL